MSTSAPSVSTALPARRRELGFNTAGPCVSGDHYMLDPLERIDLDEVMSLIDTKKYFILHAPRQTGKTTALLALMKHLNAIGDYMVVYANIEGAQTARHDVARAMLSITHIIADAAQRYVNEPRLHAWRHALHVATGPDDVLRSLLDTWASASDRPIVLFLDEVDALVGDTLVSLLRQLRAGYAQRPEAFPQSVILCGVRDVKDYRIQTTKEGIITGGSAFNVKAESLRMGNFSEVECRVLWQQHTDATGQTFDPAIYPELWEDTYGQPWLVNALGHQLTWKNRRLRDRSLPVTLEDYREAREALIQSRATHLDQLADKLKEARVHRVIASLLQAEGQNAELQNDDVQYVEDLGLVRRKPLLSISNRIYREVIPRELSSNCQDGLAIPQAPYLTVDRRLDMPKLMRAFQQFFRENSEIWLERFDYKEAGPQLLLQAFLQRIINGGGRINREYGLGLRRTDIFIEWAVDESQGYLGPVQRIVLELKILRGSVEKVMAEGLPQVVDYARRCGADEAHLLMFDRRPEISWDEKIWQDEARFEGMAVRVWGA